jgi:ABC-type proline/glycine betaine transport system ATPase subunit
MVFVTHSIEEAVLMGDRVVVLKGRPAGVHEVIEVGLPHPRSRATLAEPRFAEVREHVWSTLQDEARKAEFAVSRLGAHCGRLRCGSPARRATGRRRLSHSGLQGGTDANV